MTVSFFVKLLVLLLIKGPVQPITLMEKRQECIECHSEIVNNSFLHPDVSSSCDICHSPTGETHPGNGKNGFILSERVPELCFLCHSDMNDELISSRVVHGPLSGPSSCISCHNPHSSENPRLLISEGNDLCLSCHNKTIKTDSTKIRNIKNLIAGPNIIHQAIEGGCNTCHDPHYSDNPGLLTGLFPEEQYVKATTESFDLCFMCHDSALFTEEKTEYGTNFREGQKNLHYIHVNREKGRNCTMCHDVHGARWEHLISDKISYGNWEMRIKYIPFENGGQCLTACHAQKDYDRRER